MGSVTAVLAAAFLLTPWTIVPALPAPSASAIPSTSATALDGHTVQLPRDLAPRATILILGFSRHSAATTTAWEKAVRGGLASAPQGIGFFDMPVLAEVPGFVRPLVLRSISKQVPDVLKPNFVPLLADLGTWKQRTAYADDAPDAAYVLLVDHAGQVRWQTHEAFSADRFAELTAAARKLP